MVYQFNIKLASKEVWTVAQYVGPNSFGLNFPPR